MDKIILKNKTEFEVAEGAMPPLARFSNTST